jgi:hypothetical protein
VFDKSKLKEQKIKLMIIEIIKNKSRAFDFT